MKWKFIPLLLVLAVPLSAQQVLNLRDADIRAFIQDVARVTGRNFVIDNRVQGKVSVVTDRALSKSEYFEVFLATLRANGFVAIPMAGGGYRVQPSDTAAAQPGKIGEAGAARNQFVTEVFRLRAIEATSAVETLRPLVSREGSVTANRSGNSLVVADYADNIRRIRGLLSRIDSEGAATDVIALRNAGAREIATSLQQLATGGQAGGDGARTAVAVVAIDSSNSIALRGDAEMVTRFGNIARDLDKRAASGTEIQVYWLQHADADKLMPVLQQLVGQSGGLSSPSSASNNTSSAAPPAPVVSLALSAPSNGRAAPVIARYDGLNAVIVSAPADTQRMLSQVIRQLDTRRNQVLVEAIIVEISDDAARKLGVQFLLGGKPGSNIPFAATNYSNAAPNILTVAGAIGARQLNSTTTTVNGTTTTTQTSNAISDQLAQAAVNSILGAGGGFAGFATGIGNNGLFGTIINAVQSDTKSNILSTPSLVTLDNQEAKLLVGQEIPITTGEALSKNFDNAFRTVQRQNVGIQLEVKPQINDGGSIKLAIRQEVSSIAGPVSSNSSDLILNKREIQTTVTVDDGQIIALGGLLDDNERRTLEKIPFLGDIPGLGQLFRSRSRTRSKTNLMIFIRPTILRSAMEAQALAERRYNYVRAQQRLMRPDEEPSIDQLVRDYMDTTPPSTDPGTPSDPSQPGAPQVIEPRMRESTERIQLPGPKDKKEKR